MGRQEQNQEVLVIYLSRITASDSSLSRVVAMKSPIFQFICLFFCVHRRSDAICGHGGLIFAPSKYNQREDGNYPIT
jgi:hypothetical protein